MNDVEKLLAVLPRDPGDDAAWMALADGLAEQGEDARSELVRLQLRLRRDLGSPEQSEREQRLHQLWTAGAAPCQPILQGPMGMAFVLVPPGAFWMGAHEEEKWMDPDEAPRHRVSLTRGFWLGVHPVTQGQWQALAGDNPAHHRGELLPVENVSHEDAQEFCLRLAERMGRRAAADRGGMGICLPGGDGDIVLQRRGGGGAAAGGLVQLFGRLGRLGRHARGWPAAREQPWPV